MIRTRLELRAGKCEKRKENWFNSTGSLSGWIKRISRIPLLEEDEETELAEKSAIGDKDARNRLIHHNIRLVFWAAQYYPCLPGIQFDDLIQEGCLGLIRAVELYRKEEGAFSTFALFHIEGRMRRYIDEHTVNPSCTMPIPSSAAVLWQKMVRLEEKAYMETGDGHLSERELKLRTLSSDKSIESVRRFAELRFISADEVQDEIIDGGPGTEEAAFNDLAHDAIEKQLESLTEKEADVVRRRNGLPPYEKTYTLDEIAQAYGRTQERIRQIEMKAYRRLRWPSRAKELNCFI